MLLKHKSKLEKQQQEEVVPLHYESNRYQEREACRECGSSNVYTRVYFHEKTFHARWLCFNCADDYVEKRGYKLLTVNAVISPVIQPPPLPIKKE